MKKFHCFKDYVRSIDYHQLLEADSITLMSAIELAGDLSTPAIDTPIFVIPDSILAVTPLYNHRHLTFAGDWMLAHPIISVEELHHSFPHLKALCIEEKRHFLPSAFTVDKDFSTIDVDTLKSFGLTENKNGLVDLTVDYNVGKKNRARIKRAVDFHSDKEFVITDTLPESDLRYFISELFSRNRDKFSTASTILQLTFAYAKMLNGEKVFWVLCYDKNHGRPVTLQAFIKRSWGFSYQCMAINSERFFSGSLPHIGLACLYNSIQFLRKKSLGLLDLTTFLEPGFSVANVYKNAVIGFTGTVITQAISGYEDQNLSGFYV